MILVWGDIDRARSDPVLSLLAQLTGLSPKGENIILDLQKRREYK